MNDYYCRYNQLPCIGLANFGPFSYLSGNQIRNRTETATGHNSGRYFYVPVKSDFYFRTFEI